MPQSAVRLTETQDSITRPVVMDVVRQIQKITNTPVGTSIQYMGDIGVTYLNGDTIADPQEFNTFEYSNKLKIQVNEDFDTEFSTMLDMATWQKDTIAIFEDSVAKITVSPIYARMSVSVTCEFRLANETLADRFRNDLRIKAAQGRQDNLHEVDYNYGFPPEFLYILEQLHTLRENVAGYGDEFEEYINDHSTKKLIILTNQAGNHPRLVIGEKQIQVIGWFEFDGVSDKAEVNGEGPARTINFTYKFLYDKVIGCNIVYPMVVHNQVIPPDLYDHRPVYNPTQRRRAPSMNRFFLDQFTNLFPRPPCCLDGITIPSNDDWLPDRVPPETSTIFSAIALIDVTNPQYMLSLDDLGHWEIDEDILAFIIAERQYVTQYGKTLIHLGMYKGEVPITDGALILNEDTSVYTNNPTDLRTRYHIRLAVLNNLLMFDRRVIDRIRKHGKALLKLFDQMQCGFPNGAYTPELLSNGSISYDDWMKLALRISANKGTFYTGIEHALMTVGTYTIIVERKTKELEDAYRSGEPGQSTAVYPIGHERPSDESRISYCDRGHATEPPLLTSDVHRRTIVGG